MRESTTNNAIYPLRSASVQQPTTQRKGVWGDGKEDDRLDLVLLSLFAIFPFYRSSLH